MISGLARAAARRVSVASAAASWSPSAPFSSSSSSSSSSSTSPFGERRRANTAFKVLLAAAAAATISTTTVAAAAAAAPGAAAAVASKKDDRDSSGPFALRVGVACASKNKPKKPLPAHMRCDCGEDAYFVVSHQTHVHFGLADGVGGWAEVGVDPSEFAWDLMTRAEKAARNEPALKPQGVLDTAFNDLVAAKVVKFGSSTACLARFDTLTGELHTANLGDSGFVVLRENTVLFHSKEMQHSFNMPLQLTVQGNGEPSQDLPSHADTRTFYLHEGDFVIMATDGLFDNIYDEEIVKALQTHVASVQKSIQAGTTASVESELQTASSALVQLAKVYFGKVSRPSPFGRRLGGPYSHMGKPDDVTVIIAAVVPADPPTAKL